MDDKKAESYFMNEMTQEEIDELKEFGLAEMIEIAKKSEYGGVWYSEKGPIQITKEGKLEPFPPLKLMKGN